MWRIIGGELFVAREYVTFKGTKDGLVLWLDPHAEFNEIFDQLQEKLNLTRDFWQGVTIVLKETERECRPQEKARLEELMGEFGMALKEDVEQSSPSQVKMTQEMNRDNALIVRRTLRSGQRVHHVGSVVVLGDVNPGAEVVAGGDIIVLGTLRGIAHAGALGEEAAVVMALKLLPTQLRIAHFISRAPDHVDAPEPQGPEIAQIRNNLITIHSYGP
ncbi:MAG: septum site-determining protein MinC [Firmicutes bacterium]|nr:septum site-determining protein MinC [Bacillota bacterium]